LRPTCCCVVKMRAGPDAVDQLWRRRGCGRHVVHRMRVEITAPKHVWRTFSARKGLREMLGLHSRGCGLQGILCELSRDKCDAALAGASTDRLPDAGSGVVENLGSTSTPEEAAVVALRSGDRCSDGLRRISVRSPRT